MFILEKYINTRTRNLKLSIVIFLLLWWEEYKVKHESFFLLPSNLTNSFPETTIFTDLILISPANFSPAYSFIYWLYTFVKCLLWARILARRWKHDGDNALLFPLPFNLQPSWGDRGTHCDGEQWEEQRRLLEHLLGPHHGMHKTAK